MLKHTFPPVAILLAAAVSFGLGAAAGAADQPHLGAVRGNGKIDVTIDGKLFTTYHYKEFAKPILYPIIGPGGQAMTRDFPIKPAREGETTEHPHHKSFWHAHGSVNGVDFWSEKGHVVPTQTPVAKVINTGDDSHVVITGSYKWVGPDGKIVCTDDTTISFHALPDDTRMIDFKIIMHASHGDITFGDTKEGTMAIRTHPALRLTGSVAKGHALNSEGVMDKALWGKRANWVDYWAPIHDKVVGVAIFDHPSNPRHPTWWHAREYGLIAANPFGIHNFEGKPAGTGDMTVEKGKSITFRYRFVFHKGDAKAANIARLYEQYAADKTVN